VLLNPDGTPQTAQQWTQQHGASLTAPVVPSVVPYYVLIVGSPERIPFSFQFDLSAQWLVGRLYFDDIADYGRYAAHVIAQEIDPGNPEQTPLPPQPAQTAVWITSNQGDVATTMLANALSGDFQATDGIAQAPIGQDWGFGVDFSLRAAHAARHPFSSLARTARRPPHPSPTRTSPTSAASRGRSSRSRGFPTSPLATRISSTPRTSPRRTSFRG
jgi:hypothetical protein